MTIFTTLIYSIKKSKKLAKLQRVISPPKITMGKVDDDFINDLISSFRSDEPRKALEEFIDLCVSDEKIKHLMYEHNISRDGLKDIYHSLARSGAGQWVKGHYAALSSIAYSEPLAFYLEAKKHSFSDLAIAMNLLDYWQGRIKQGYYYRS
jgi:hypothetical protein